MTGLAILFLGPLIFGAALLLAVTFRRFRLLPTGVSRGISVALFTSLGMGGLFLGTTLDNLIFTPMRLQRELLGHQIASPTALRFYAEFGFQDPVWLWRYEIAPNDAAK